MISGDLAFYVALGFGAQLVDGALGMAYGLIATSVLLTSGASPALSSASVHAAEVVTIGVAGGFLDAIGGGGWGPIVNSTLIARGATPRLSIGSVSLAEFLVTAAISATFVMTLELASYGQVVLGLIIGGALRGPVSGRFRRGAPPQVVMN